MKKKPKRIIRNKDTWQRELRQAMVTVLKELLEKQMEWERDAYTQDTGEAKNGYYERKELRTPFGTVRNLAIPRTREGGYYPSFLEPHHRHLCLDGIVLQMYAHGMSTRDIVRFIENTYGAVFSPTSISRLTHIVREEVEAWRNRPLKSRYLFVFIDATFIPLRRDTCQKEAIFIALGVDEEGYREILGFYIFPSEGAENWKTVLEDLKQRGVEEVELFISDHLAGIEDAIHRVYPQAQWQACVLHAVRRVMRQVRHRDRNAMLRDLRFYRAATRDEAETRFEAFVEKWAPIYPRVVRNLHMHRDALLRFYDYPETLRKHLYTTNLLERFFGELKRRFRPIGMIPNLAAAEKLCYLLCVHQNEAWSRVRMRGFRQLEESHLSGHPAESR